MANRDLTPWTRSPGLTPFGRDPFSAFRQEMDRLFEDFFAPAETRSFGAAAPIAAAVSPVIDVEETEQAYTVTAEVPGLDQKEIELSLRDNALTISGEKRAERHEENGGRRYSERSFGRFQRTIPFAAEVDADKVEAKCANGVLTITLPKNAKAQDKTRKIEIKGETAAKPAEAPAAAAASAASAASGSGQ